MTQKSSTGTTKKLKKDIFATRIDGNVFVIAGKFSKQALKEGWTRDEVAQVVNEAKQGDYDYFIQTLMGHIE